MGTDSPSISSRGDRDEQLSITHTVGPCLSHLKSVLVSCVATSSSSRAPTTRQWGRENRAVGGLVQLWGPTHAQPRACWRVAQPWTAKQWQGDAPVSLQRGK